MKMNLRRAFVLLLIMLLILSSVTVSGAAASGEILPDGTYVIYTECLYTCLNVQYKKSDGGKVCVDNANLETNEMWILTNVGDGYVRLAPYHASNCYLGHNGFDQQLIIRQTRGSSYNYHWKPLSVGNGAYVFVNRANSSCVIDVRCGENTKVGNPVLLYTRNGYSAAQSLYPVRISHYTALVPSTRVFDLETAAYKVTLYNDSNQAWNAQYGLKAGAWMVCDPFNGEANETLYIKNEGNGLYSIRFASNTALCIAPSSVFAPAQLQVKNYDGSLGCHFELYKIGSAYWFRNAFTGLMVDYQDGATRTGTPIQCYSYHDHNAQKFYLTKVSTSSSSSTDYATYTGINYRNLTSDSRRIAACDKAVQMATVLWKNTCEFPTWRSSGGVYNTVTAVDETSSTKFLSGKTYQGIPYSMAGRTYDDVSWLKLVDQGLSTSKMTAKYYRSYADTTAKGIDCSYLVCTALNAGCGTSINLNTNSMLNSSRFYRVSRAQMLPGDIFLKSGHVMLFLGKTSSGKYAIVEANAAYSRVVYREVSYSEVSAYGCYRYTGFN